MLHQLYTHAIQQGNGFWQTESGIPDVIIERVDGIALRTEELGFAEVGIVETDAAEAGAGEIAPCQIRSDKVRFDDFALFKTGFLDVHKVKIAATQKAARKAQTQAQGVAAGEIYPHQFAAFKGYPLKHGIPKRSKREIAIFEGAAIQDTIEAKLRKITAFKAAVAEIPPCKTQTIQVSYRLVIYIFQVIYHIHHLLLNL